jgi:hypothetical protein
MKLVGISGTRKREYLREKLMSFKQIVRISVLEVYIEEYMNLRWVINLERIKR